MSPFQRQGLCSKWSSSGWTEELFVKLHLDVQEALVHLQYSTVHAQLGRQQQPFQLRVSWRLEQ
jgi:hypothetical protein